MTQGAVVVVAGAVVVLTGAMVVGTAVAGGAAVVGGVVEGEGGALGPSGTLDDADGGVLAAVLVWWRGDGLLQAAAARPRRTTVRRGVRWWGTSGLLRLRLRRSARCRGYGLGAVVDRRS